MPEDSTDTWKKKYSVMRERLEQQERYLGEVEALMRHTIARLSIVAESGDPRLSRDLDKLRKAARADKPPAELRSLIENVASTAKHLERPGKTARTDVSELPIKKRILHDIVDHIRLPDAERTSTSTILKTIESATLENELDRLAKEFTAIVNRVIGRDVSAAKSATARAPTARRLLAELLSSLPVPGEFAPRLEELQDTVEQRVSDDNWMPALSDIATFIGDMRRRLEIEKAELEDFLRQLQDRLKDLDQQLEVAESTRRASVDSSQRLDRRMDAEVNDIESSVHRAESLDQVKVTIQKRVDVIRTHMDEHRRAEVLRQTELEQKLKHATARLQAVEQETTHLRAHLKKRKLQAMSDPLTGIPNRAAFEERIEREFTRWKRYATPLALLIMDVDHFKRINDTYGHRAGDKALKLIALVLKQNIRETDLVARYGGEEFAVIVPQTPVEGVTALAEKLRLAVERAQFHYQGASVPITISSGFTMFRGDDTAETVLQRADKALYQAKSEGRNRVCRDSD
jgi:diguanylate cyclase